MVKLLFLSKSNLNLIELFVLIFTFLIFLISKLSATTLTGLFFIFKLITFIDEDEGKIFPFHLLGLKGLIGVTASFFELIDSMGP